MTKLKYIDVNGDRIAYRDAGAGETLVLIHDVGGSSETWNDLADQLACDFRVVAPDLLGHGASATPQSDYSLGGLTVWLRDFLDAVGVTRASLIGHSLGANIALRFAHQSRTRTERLVLVHSRGTEPTHRPQLSAELPVQLIGGEPGAVADVIGDFLATTQRRSALITRC